MTKSRGILGPRRPWHRPELYQLHRLYPDTPAYELARIFGRSVNKIYAKANQIGLHKSAAYLAGPFAGRIRPDNDIGGKTRFKKGQAPHNKGLRRPGWGPGRMKQTQFTKGQRSWNWVPVGSYRVSSEGYLDLKVADHGPGSMKKNWIPVHRLVWIQHHGPVPPGHTVCFKTDMRTTEVELITIDRLELVSRVELMRRNSYHTRYPKQICQLIQLRGALNRQIRKRERNEKQDPTSA